MKYLIENINNLDQYQLLIKDYKRITIDKIKNIDDKKRSILGEILLINGLKDLNIDYYNIDITLNTYGKPYIIDSNIKYNISHSHDYVICAFSNKEIGVDIEKIRDVNVNIINQFATSNEIKYILSRKKNILNRLFTIYTLKEAYFKMLGENLNNIKNVEFKIKNHHVYCSDPKTKFKIINSLDGYIISICERI